MLVLLSPAKRLNEENKIYRSENCVPSFQAEAVKVNASLKKLSTKKLLALQNISVELAAQNRERNQVWNTQTEDAVYKEALYLFNGDAYLGLQAETLSENAKDFAKQHLRILSGLYGLLNPFDVIEPYRLEMGTKLKVGRADSLYAFWKKKVTTKLKADFPEGPIVNLASTEYASAIDFKALKNPVVSVDFKAQNAQGEYKVMSFFAKKARGMMTRFILENAITDVAHLKAFCAEGYTFSANDSNLNKLVFLREHKTA